ncbi:MAG: hypothetical protein KH180_13995 [Anaerostipes sp.]|nr:hypothetical protein [Anaerostipes sp.]
MKGENAGFAKIEKRQKQLRLYFHVKTNDEALTYKIYFYRFRHGTMEGILLDSFQRNDTIIEFKNTYPLVVDLDQVDGFLIYHSNSHFFGSEWNDKPITIRSFLPADTASKQTETVSEEVDSAPAPSEKQAVPEQQADSEPAPEENSVPANEEQPEPAQGESIVMPAPEVTEQPEPAQDESTPESAPLQNPASAVTEEPDEEDEEPPASAPDPPSTQDPFDELPQEIPIPEETPETESTVPEPAPVPAGTPPRVYVEPEIPEPEPVNAESVAEEEPPKEETAADANSKLAEYIEALQLEKKAKEQGVSGTPGLFDWKEYPTLPLPPSYMLDPSIKLKVDDLQNIPDVPENLQTNGFLLLNYGSYGHLMLCQHKHTKRLYLGIPGIFDNEKNFIAKLFGFKNFLTVPEVSQKTGNFGYWILAL